jgi:Calcineurin-like phosphoesterase
MILTINVGFILIVLMLNQVHALRIMTIGDFDCSNRSLETMDSILKYLKQNKTDRFIFLGDIDYRNHTDLRKSYSVCGQQFFEQAQKYTELRILRGNHENNTTWKNITDHFDATNDVWHEKVDDVLLIGMNSEKPFQNNSKQYRSVSHFLDERADHKFIFIHSPGLPEVCGAVTKDTRKMCGFYELYHPMFVKKGVDCVVQAHLHTMAMFQKDELCYPIYGMGGAIPEVINPRYADITFTSNQAGFTVIETIPDKEIHTFYANDGTKTKFVFDD